MSTSVYQVTNRINNKVYFGKASNIESRWYQHIWDAEHGKDFPLHRALRKYGVAAFSFEVLAVHATNEAACFHEKALIAAVPQGLKYNVAEGGDGGPTMTPSQLDAQYTIKASQYEEFRECFNAGWTIERLCKHFGASYNAVKSCASRLRLSFSERRSQRASSRLQMKKQRNTTQSRVLRRPKMTATEYSAFRAEVARRSNKSRGLSEGLQQQALNLYFEEGLTAKQVADRLGTTKGSIRGAVNRAYDRMTPEEHSKLKTHHGSVVRTGARNSNYRGTL